MKITILFLALIALGFSVKAQRMALADNKTHGTTAASASTPIPAKTPQFVFTNYGIDLNHADLKEYPQPANCMLLRKYMSAGIQQR